MTNISITREERLRKEGRRPVARHAQRACPLQLPHSNFFKNNLKSGEACSLVRRRDAAAPCARATRSLSVMPFSVMSRFTVFVFLFTLIVTTSHAQSVRWEPSNGSLAKGQVTKIQLVFTNCQPEGTGTLPAVPGLELRPTKGRSQSFSTVNGRTTKTVSIGIDVQPSTDQHIVIPAFKINTDKGELTVASASFDIGDATVLGDQNRHLPLDQIATAKLTAPAAVWAGEVFPLAFTITADKRFIHALGNEIPDWDALPLNIEPWPKHQVTETIQSGELWVNIIYNTRAVVRTSGKVTLNPATQIVHIDSKRPVDASVATIAGSMTQRQQFLITSDQPTITVKTLPGGASKSFSGAVGQFKLESKIVPENAIVGEPITWTLTLSGTGNWPDIHLLPPRFAPKDFRASLPQAKRTPKSEASLYNVTLSERVVLVPTKFGPSTFDPIEWSYFDPVEDRYVTITTPATTIEVSPADAQKPKGKDW